MLKDFNFRIKFKIFVKVERGDFTYRRVMHKKEKRKNNPHSKKIVLCSQRNYFIIDMIGIIKCMYMVTFTKKATKNKTRLTNT